MEKHSNSLKKRIIDIFFYKYICGTRSPVKWHEVSWQEIVVARSHPNSFAYIFQCLAFLLSSILTSAYFNKRFYFLRHCL